MMRLLTFLVLTGAVAACASTAEPATNTNQRPPAMPAASSEPTGFLNRTVTVDGATRRYVVYVPFDYTGEQAWPLVVFFHGSGERGDDGLIQTEVGLGSALRRHPERYPAIVVMPQCPAGRWWDAALPHVKAALADVEARYNIDPTRRYLTGLSMGGYLAWSWGALHPGRWAAIVPICGGGKPEDMQRLSEVPLADIFGTLEERVAALARVPIWAWHGAEDEVVPAFRSATMVRLVEEAGGTVRYSELEGVGHNAWDPAYTNPLLPAWLFMQRKTAPSAQE